MQAAAYPVSRTAGSADPSGRPRARRLLADVLLVVLAALVYAPSLSGEFVFDDRLLVLDNEIISEPPWNLPSLLGPSVGGRIAYRPLRTLSYMIDYQIGGGFEPVVFHLSNLGYHAATVLAVHALARALLGATMGAFFAAAMFAVHPLGSEAVAYVSGRRDLLCALFAVLALRAWWWFLERRLSPNGRTAGPLAATLLLGLASLAAKETALVLPILAALLAAVHVRRHPSVPARTSYGTLARAAFAMGVAALVLYPDRFVLAWHRIWVGPLAPQPAFSLQVIGKYLALALWPATLVADYRHGAFPLPTSRLDASAAIAGIALGALLAAGAVLLWRGRVAGAGLLWFFVALLPVAQIVPYAEVISEHNAYLPLVGLCLAAGEGLDALATRRQGLGVCLRNGRLLRSARHRDRGVAAPSTAETPAGAAPCAPGAWRFSLRRHFGDGLLALAAAAVVLLALGTRSFVRSGDWRDEVTLWTATLEAAPRSLRAHYNLGIALRREARWAEAERALARAVEVDPRDTDSLVALAEVRGRLGDYEGAARTARRAIELSPSAPAYAVLGWSRVALGAPFAARRGFRKALEIDGTNSDAIRGLKAVRDQVRPRTRMRTDDGPPTARP